MSHIIWFRLSDSHPIEKIFITGLIQSQYCFSGFIIGQFFGTYCREEIVFLSSGKSYAKTDPEKSHSKYFGLNMKLKFSFNKLINPQKFSVIMTSKKNISLYMITIDYFTTGDL